MPCTGTLLRQGDSLKDGTQVLLEASRAVGLKRFLMVSTDEVYGSLGPTGAFTEESPLQPSSPYSASKTAARRPSSAKR